MEMKQTNAQSHPLLEIRTQVLDDAKCKKDSRATDPKVNQWINFFDILLHDKLRRAAREQWIRRCAHDSIIVGANVHCNWKLE